MTNFLIYIVYDSKSESYGMPVYEETRRDALENWRVVANGKEENNKVSKFPSDFTLFEIGSYDRQSGNFNLFESKINLGLAIEQKISETIAVNN